jgi:hypothetical protein
LRFDEGDLSLKNGNMKVEALDGSGDAGPAAQPHAGKAGGNVHPFKGSSAEEAAKRIYVIRHDEVNRRYAAF